MGRRNFLTVLAGTKSYHFVNPEAAAVVAAMAVKPTDVRKAVIDTLVGSLKTAGIWTLLDTLYLTAAHDANAALINWKNPGTFNLIAVNAPAFQVDRGYTGDGSTSRLRTQFTPSTSGVNLTQDSASVWLWNLTEGQGAQRDIGSQSGAAIALLLRNATDQVQGFINDASSSTVSATVAAGFHGMSRVSSTTKRRWKDGAQVGTDLTVTSTGISAQEQWMCGANSAAFSTRQQAAAAWGASLTGKEAAFYNALLAYMQAVGAALTAGQLATLASLKSVAASSLISNPVDAADFTSPPTLNISAVHDATLSVRANPLTDLAKFRFSPGQVYVRTSSNLAMVATSNNFPDTGNLSTFADLTPTIKNVGEQQLTQITEVTVIGRNIELQVGLQASTSCFRIICIGLFFSRDGISPVSQYVKWDMGSNATWVFKFEFQGSGGGLKGISTDAGGSISAPTDTVISGICTGDSLLEFISGGDTNFHVWDGPFPTFCKKVGINGCQVAAVGATGYYSDFSGARRNINGQMDDWVYAAQRHLVLLNGGFNDVTLTTSANTAALCLADLQKTRQAQPNALIVLMGILGQATGPNSNILNGESALATMFSAWNDRFSMLWLVSTDPGGAWLTGTGNVSAPTGVGNADLYVSSDGKHFTRAGGPYTAGKMNTIYRTQLAAIR